jgi:hypothetical protein
MSTHDWFNYIVSLTCLSLIICAIGLRGALAHFARQVLAIFGGIALTYAVTIWLGITFVFAR